MRSLPLQFGLACLFLLFAPVFLLAQEKPAAPDLKELESYTTKAMQEWNVPGLGFAIVKDDKVVFAKGFGVRKLGEPTPVDEHSVFAIASCSKAFTAAALGILVDEGKIKWDDPVTKYLPQFQLYDAYATREMTIRDLLCHRSGLATFGGDLLWYDTTYSRDEVIRRVRHLKPTSSFRSRYGYQNIMFSAAGQIIPAVTGKSWDEFIKERFFTPLGMTSSSTSINAFKPGDNLAQPHNQPNGTMRVVKYLNVDNVGPAASINSSVADLAQWVRLQLGRGTYQSKQIFSRAVSHEMWSPNTVQPLSEAAERQVPSRHFSLYAMGWGVSDFHGRKYIAHSGGLDGMISQVVLVPEENLGVVILTNSESPLASLLARKVVDMYVGAPARDWSGEALAQRKNGEDAQKKADELLETGRAKDTKPSLALEKYAGTYSGQMYGDATVTVENGKLAVKLLPSVHFTGDLEHWHYDTFRLTWRDTNYPFRKGFVTFILNAQGAVEEMKVDCPNNDFDFKELEFKRVKP
ncbi:MAG: serine hydrolase [Blastocatellia bacterium]|nr:serine hydrolase [Blastocatellia bacterium]